jgi:hypothetical protein
MTGASSMAVVSFVNYKSQFYKVSHDYLLLKACILCLFLSRTVECVLWCEKYLRLARLTLPYFESSVLHLVLSGLAVLDLKVTVLFLIQINHQPDTTVFQFIILTFIYSSTCFGGSSAHYQELNDCTSSLWFCIRIMVIVVLCSWSGLLKHLYHHDTKVTPAAATAVIELLLMGGRTPETC